MKEHESILGTGNSLKFIENVYCKRKNWEEYTVHEKNVSTMVNLFFILPMG